jgi:hypothetical protein
VSDDAASLFVSGLPNTSLRYCSLYIGQTYDEDYPDEINPYGGSTLCMKYSTDTGAGVEYTGTFGNSSSIGKLIYLAFPLETTADDNAFDLVISNALLYFDPSIVAVDDDKDLTLSYSLEQNYPNPFNPTTRIEYRIQKGGFVALKIFDLLGNQISTLVSEQKAPGIYEVEWNAHNQPSGVYFCTVQADNFYKSMKMILLK